MNFTKKEINLLVSLNTPVKVQDFLNSIPFNFERDDVDTLKSPLRTLRENNAHCFEGALLGAYILSFYGHKPRVMYLKSTKHDFDHVVALFKINGYWGALSKTNHNVLRYREPIYKNVRELAMTYFHEYFLDNGLKTLRAYSDILDLSIYKKGQNKDWAISEKDLWFVDAKLDKLKHHNILLPSMLKKLRKADGVEIQAGKLLEYKK